MIIKKIIFTEAWKPQNANSFQQIPGIIAPLPLTTSIGGSDYDDETNFFASLYISQVDGENWKFRLRQAKSQFSLKSGEVPVRSGSVAALWYSQYVITDAIVIEAESPDGKGCIPAGSVIVLSSHAEIGAATVKISSRRFPGALLRMDPSGLTPEQPDGGAVDMVYKSKADQLSQFQIIPDPNSISLMSADGAAGMSGLIGDAVPGRHTGPGSGSVQCGLTDGGSWNSFRMGINADDGTYSFSFMHVFLRGDGRTISSSTPGPGGIVNFQGVDNTYERFDLEGIYDGNVPTHFNLPEESAPTTDPRDATNRGEYPPTDY